MNRFTKKIRCLITILILAFPLVPVFAQQDQQFPGETPSTPISDCRITSVKTDPVIDGKALVTIASANCSGWSAKVVVTTIINAYDTAISSWISGIEDNTAASIPLDASGTTSIVLLPGEQDCGNPRKPNCTTELTLTPFKGNQFGTEFKVPDQFKYSCFVKDICNTNRPWGWLTKADLEKACQVTSATFGKSKDTGYVGENNGDEKYSGTGNSIIIKTRNCVGAKSAVGTPISIYVTLVEGSGDLDTGDVEEDLLNVQLEPQADEATLNVRTGERRCNNGKNPNCEYHLVAGLDLFEKLSGLDPIMQYHSFAKTAGRLAYNCDGICSDFWELIGVAGAKATGSKEYFENGVDLEDAGVTIDPNSACLGDDGKPIDGCYEVYGGLGDLLKERLNLLDNKFDTLKQDSLGGLINAIIALATGVAGVLAVGMIMYQGFLMMKTDNVNTRTEAKSRILKTTLGFLLLLSIYVILRTINPDLLNINPSIAAVTLKVEEGQDPNEVLDQNIKTNPNLAKIYAASKGHWRDGGSLNPNNTNSRKAVADGVAPSTLMDLSVKGVAIKAGTGKNIESTVGPKIVALNNTLKSKGVSMTVTEAFKPGMYTHYAACHYKATCIDADVPFSVSNVNTLISEAQKVGLVAVWETANNDDYEALIKAGVPQSNVLIFSGHITGDHASVYDYKP